MGASDLSNNKHNFESHISSELSLTSKIVLIRNETFALRLENDCGKQARNSWLDIAVLALKLNVTRHSYNSVTHNFCSHDI